MRKIKIVSVLLAFLLTVGGIFYLYSRVKVGIDIPPSAYWLAKKENFPLKVEVDPNLPLLKLEVSIIQGTHKVVLYSGKPQNGTFDFEIDTSKAGLKDGKAQIVAKLLFPWGGEKIVYRKEITVDGTPPSVEVLHKPRRLIVGEPGVLIVKTSEDTEKIFLSLGEAKFPLLKVGDNTYKTIFTAPLFLLKNPERFYIVAIDKAGNITRKFIPIALKLKKFRKVKIELTDQTLERIVLKYFNDTENALKKFKVINEQYRKEDHKKLLEICQNSQSNFYPVGAFKQLPGSKPTARFGDDRTYYYKGKVVSKSVHKGLDLAKYRHAPVVASNNGKVIFVGRLKIYGNVILIDHGFGLFTLYAHLNDFTVKEGDIVKKGDIIGHTDTTGLALGDHLHFGVLIWGYAANPIFFFDKKYLSYYLYPYFGSSN